MNPVDLIFTPESSQITAIGYDAQSQTLVIRFKSNGAVYHYFDVPPATWEGFKAAESKGRFFGKNIKSVFRYQRQL